MSRISSRFLAGVVLLAGFVGSAAAQLPTGSQLVLSPKATSKFLNDGKTVFLQVGTKASYDKEHVPGAQLVTLDDISLPHKMPHQPGELSLEMLTADSLRASLQRFGISDDSRVVVMFSDEWGSPATRVLFTLGYAGLGAQAYLMEGGVEAWKRDGLPVTNVVTKPKPGRITKNPITSLIVDYAYVQGIRSGSRVKLVDARDSIFYFGPSSTMGKAGHIPGAVSMPFGTFADDSMRMIPVSVIEQRFRAAGIAPGDTVVTYCHIGQQGTFTMFAARLAGHPVKLYDGSMDDWNQRKLPIDSTSVAAKKGN